MVAALSIDYSLFLLSRFQQEIAIASSAAVGARAKATAGSATGGAGPDMQAVVRTVLGTAGRVVLLSGSTLACTMASLMFLPFCTCCVVVVQMFRSRHAESAGHTHVGDAYFI